jgi:hypothetical protein
MMTPEEYADHLLEGQKCAGCGHELTPDAPCPECGMVPPVTGPELRAALKAAPLTVAEAEAAQAEAEAFRILDQAITKFHEADVIRYTAKLELLRDQANAALAAHQKQHQEMLARPTFASALAKAQRKAERIARKLTEAQEYHAVAAAEERKADRYDKGAEVEAAALRELERATVVLNRYQAKDAKAKAEVARLTAPVTASEQAAEGLKAALAKAQAELENPGRIGYGAKAITNGMMRLLAGDRLSAPERLMAGKIARWICAATGTLDDIVAEGRRQVAAEREARARRSPSAVGRQNGEPVAVVNPHHRGSPAVLPGGVTTAAPATPPNPGWNA